ncbi:MAG: hypothetical protein QM680_08330 [Luteolibacter sp.]
MQLLAVTGVIAACSQLIAMNPTPRKQQDDEKGIPAPTHEPIQQETEVHTDAVKPTV